MSTKIKLTEVTNTFGHANGEFIDLIDERYTSRIVGKLVGVGNVPHGTMYGTPIVKRNDEDTYTNHRLTIVLGHTMGILNWENTDLDCGPLLGLYDYKGWLTSFWYQEPKLEHIHAVHNAWHAQSEHLHYAVIYHGKTSPETRQFDVDDEVEDEATT